MAGGLGASWHAIGPTPSWYGDLDGRENRICRGSGFGGYPPLGFTRAWDDLRAHARWLGLSFCRVEFDVRMYEPGRRRFDWDNDEMKALERILDICQANQAERVPDADVAGRFLERPCGSQPFAERAPLGRGLCRGAGRALGTPGQDQGIHLHPLGGGQQRTGFQRRLVAGAGREGGRHHARRPRRPRGAGPAGLGQLSVAGPDSFNLGMAGFQAEDKAVGALALHCYEGQAPLELFRTAAATARSRGIPLFVTEFGHFFVADCEGLSFAEGGPRSPAPKATPPNSSTPRR